MKPFLKQIAQIYWDNERENLIDCCFVFPNKRSGVFFNQYLEEVADHSAIFPNITTISDLINGFSSGVEASRYEQLFILYNLYKSLSMDISEFDQFQYWGDMILNDFNDVDRYMVDPEKLFVNVKRLKEINSNYLTSEQIKIIDKYWGENRFDDHVGRFWKHLDYECEEELPRDRFLKLWEILYELYVRFNAELTERGLSYSGRSYREAAKALSKISNEELQYKRYIFVGFNVLSTSELSIFEKLQELDCADFYWDYNSPAYVYDFHKATRFIRRYVKTFKSRYDLDEGRIEKFPAIELIGVPSNVGQVKQTSQILIDLVKEKYANPQNAVNTAIVLPDENLFIPLMNSYPREFETVNITMGYPMRFTAVSALMKAIVSMQLRARKVKEQWVFYYEDVQMVLAQPLIRAIAPMECEKIQNYISKNRMFNLSADYLSNEYPSLNKLFTPVKNISDFNDVFCYAIDLVEYIKSLLEENNRSILDKVFLFRYQNALEQLRAMVDKYNIEMHEHTFFHLIERMIGADSINFEGEPLNGLQIMGVLETRALDFENVILLSMNERIFPRKHFSRSFIPDALRRGYGMSTIEFQESIYAYYFYRMISRAKRVYLLYDARTSGIKSGEMSRYLYQLKYLYPHDSIKSSLVNYSISPIHREAISIPKTDDVIAKLNQFRYGQGIKVLSPSAIKRYISCPLQFYLEFVEGLRIEDEIKDYMDDITYGNIVHEVAELLYKGLNGPITAEVLEREKKDELKLQKLITRSVNKNYNKLGEDNDTPLYGEAKVLAEIMLYSIKEMLEEEKKFAPIFFVAAEFKKDGIELKKPYVVSDDLKINIKMIIDRIDRVKVGDEERLRIVDYKTGGDDIAIGSFEDVFDYKGSKSKNNGAIMQLFAYCNFYSLLMNHDGPIQPIIYKLRTLKTDGLQPIKIGKQIVNDYKEFNDAFLDGFNDVIKKIFDPDVPFTQTDKPDHCKYCGFKNICCKDIK